MTEDASQGWYLYHINSFALMFLLFFTFLTHCKKLNCCLQDKEGTRTALFKPSCSLPFSILEATWSGVRLWVQTPRPHHKPVMSLNKQ